MSSRARKILHKMNIVGKKYKAASYEDVAFPQKPDSIGEEKRIDAHSLFSMFTANMIKEKIKWFR